jgi:hypothetical protein
MTGKAPSSNTQPGSNPTSVFDLDDFLAQLTSLREAHDESSLAYARDFSEESLKDFLAASMLLRISLSDAIDISSQQGDSDGVEVKSVSANEALTSPEERSCAGALRPAIEYANQLSAATMIALYRTYPLVKLPLPKTSSYSTRYSEMLKLIKAVQAEPPISTSIWDNDRVDRIALAFAIIRITPDLLNKGFLSHCYAAAEEWDATSIKS